ncbi:MAG: succinate dehydrogenase/fumarate reductase iron-sulfur subunit [Rhodospirillales bacterium]|nr:succinate dehydrogenase/fumarate reductase iron-sulfur subunit [Rhodospirillales bacterium]
MPADGGTLEVRVWRGGAEGRYVPYAVPRRQSQTVLDAVSYIQRHLDASLSYRFACRVGMCGSCAMTVNGKPRWTCRTHVAKVARGGALTVGPLRNLPVIKDLACDMAPFFDKWAKAEGRFRPPTEPARDFVPVRPASPARQAADAGIECIGCAVCYAACDVVAANPDYLGPAALNRAWTLVNDVRDAGQRERLAAVAGDAGCHACHSQQGCREYCPKHLNPTAAIAGLKRVTARAALKGEI